MTVIQCNNVSKLYKDCKALDDLSFSIEENKITGLIGRNGAGKTTLLRLLCGYNRQTSGEIRVFDEKPFNNLKVSSNTVFIDDNMSFPKYLTLEEIIKCAEDFYPMFNKKFCIKLMEYFRIKGNKKHTQLSKGMESTFNMIIGISSRCALTIMDEPTTGMDAAVRKDFYKILLKDYIEYPRSIIISSHLLNELEDILEDILLLKDGSKYLHLPLTELKEYALGYSGKKEDVKRFIGGREVLFEENFGRESVYAVVRAEDYEAELNRAKTQGLDVKPISPADLCIYLTGNGQGGINYVFSE